MPVLSALAGRLYRLADRLDAMPPSERATIRRVGTAALTITMLGDLLVVAGFLSCAWSMVGAGALLGAAAPVFLWWVFRSYSR